MRDELVDAGVSASVEVVCWNPRRPVRRGRAAKLLPVRRRVSNFGDMLGPQVVRLAALRESLDLNSRGPSNTDSRSRPRLLSVGSILHFSRPGDVIWGSGINGKVDLPDSALRNVRVAAVRGRLTSEILSKRGVDVPAAFADPAVLLPELLPITAPPVRRDYVIVPNLHDYVELSHDSHVVNPQSSWMECVRAIGSADLVIASSLHGLILADVMAIPYVRLSARLETDFKYEDYFSATDRPAPRAAIDLQQALRASPEVGGVANRQQLLEAFPRDLWKVQQ